MARCTRYNKCDRVYQRLVPGEWFSFGTQVSSTNKTDCHNITEILLKVTLKNITPNSIPCSNNIYTNKQGTFQYGMTSLYDDNYACFVIIAQHNLIIVLDFFIVLAQ